MEGCDGSDGLAIGPPSSDSGPMLPFRSLGGPPVKDKSAFKRNRTTPSRNALCVRLAAHDHLAGIFLVSILHWAKYGRAEIPGVEGEWVANPRSWWRRECCLSSSQYDRSISKLKKLGLIETRQWWWGYKNIQIGRASCRERV